jgi:hypothetical protein
VLAAINGDQTVRDPETPVVQAIGSPSCRQTRAADVPAGGYFGRALVVDVSDGTSSVVPLPTRCCATTSVAPGSAPGC